MKWWQELALGAYYTATLNARRREATVRAANGREPVIVLFYHRVADSHPNDWTIDTETFAGQIRWLQERFDIVPLAEAQHRIDSGSNRWPTVAITFDDGYADNCNFALPLLLREKIPFTYFVTTQNLCERTPFLHDLKAGQPLQPNTPEEVAELAAAGVEIGAHSQTHVDLGQVKNTEELEREIVDCKAVVESLVKRPVRYFAFPYGQAKNITRKAFRMAFAAGYAGVCSAYGGYNFPGEDAFHLQRIHGDREWIRFRNWLTLDPRKLKSVARFDPGNYRKFPENFLGTPDPEFVG